MHWHIASLRANGYDEAAQHVASMASHWTAFGRPESAAARGTARSLEQVSTVSWAGDGRERRGYYGVAARPAGDDTAPPELIPGQAATAALADAMHDAECECQDRAQHEAETGTSYWESARTGWRQGWRPAAAGPRVDGGDTAPPAEPTQGDRCPATGVRWDDKRAHAAILRALNASGVEDDYDVQGLAGDIIGRLRHDEHLVGDRSLRIARERRAAAGPRAGDTAPEDEQQRNRRLAERIASGGACALLDDEMLAAMRQMAGANLNPPGPRVVQLLAEYDRLRARVAELEGAGNALAAEVIRAMGHVSMNQAPAQEWLGAGLRTLAEAWRSAAGSPTTTQETGR